MPATTATAVTRKRKSLSVSSKSESTMEKDDSSKRRKTLDAFFTPQHTLTVTSASGEGKGDFNEVRRENVTLNEEQVQVLKMVVEEEKSVFFTGAAGEQFFVWLPPVSYTQPNISFHRSFATLF